MATRNRANRNGLEMSLVNEKGYLNVNVGQVFIYKNKKYCIIETDYNENSNTPYCNFDVWKALDTVKNVDSGNKMKLTRKELLKINKILTK